MTEDTLFIIGEAKRIAHVVDGGDTAFVVSAVAMTIYDANGAAVVTGAAGTVDSTIATSHEISYLWTPTTAGDYTYLMTYTVASQTLGIRGQAVVLSAASKFDKWVNRIIDWLVLSEMGEAQRDLSWKQLRDAALAAVRRYSRERPRREISTVALSSGVWEYALPSDWDYEISAFQSLEYPVNAAVEYRPYLSPDDWRTDDLRAVWGFTRVIPSAGQTARIVYTAPHILTDSADTVPTQDFEAVTQYAAGLALEQLANRAPRTGAPGIGADYVEARTKQQQYAAQATRMMDGGRKAWGGMRIYVA